MFSFGCCKDEFTHLCVKRFVFFYILFMGIFLWFFLVDLMNTIRFALKYVGVNIWCEIQKKGKSFPHDVNRKVFDYSDKFSCKLLTQIVLFYFIDLLPNGNLAASCGLHKNPTDEYIIKKAYNHTFYDQQKYKRIVII